MRLSYDKKIATEGRTRKRKYVPKDYKEKETIRFYRFSTPRTITW